MTGYRWPTFWRAQNFCAINGYDARGQYVFCKQTADLVNKILSAQGFDT